MALQMQNALAGDIAEFGRFDLVQGVLARTKPLKHVIAGGIARMNGGALIPVPAVDFEVVGHVSSMLTYAIALQAYPARAARRSDCGGWPNERMKARRIRSGSRNPVVCATRSIASPEDCTRCRATSIRKRSTAFDGVEPVSAMKARAKCRELMPACSAMSSTVSGSSRCRAPRSAAARSAPPAPSIRVAR